MRYYKKTPDFSFVPGLVRERLQHAPEKEIGFLYVNDPLKKMQIAAVISREFRLVQALFSPQNSLSAKYNPVRQTYERLFAFMGVRKALPGGQRLAPHKSDEHMEAAIHTSIRNLKKTEAGRHLRFIAEEGMLRMEVIPIAI